MEHQEVVGAETWRPDLVVWCASDRAVLGSKLVRPDAPEQVAIDALEEAMTRPAPLSGPPRRPLALRVSDEELRDALVAHYKDAFQVSVGDTSPADGYIEMMLDGLGSTYDLDAMPMLDGGLVPEAMLRTYLDAMRDLYAAVPWGAFHDASRTMRARIQALGIDEGCLVVFADDDQRGFSLYRTMADYESDDARLPRAVRPHGTRFFVAAFDSDALVVDERYNELKTLGWDTNLAEGLVPGLAAYDYGECLRVLTPDDVALAIVCARALMRVAGELERHNDEPRTTLHAVEGPAGTVEVELTSPHPDIQDDPDEPIVINPKAADLDEVLDAFMTDLRSSNEQGEWTGWAASCVGIFLQYASESHSEDGEGGPIDLRALPDELEPFLLDYSPRKVSGTEASIQATPVALRRFFQWLQDVGHVPAARCVAARTTIDRVTAEFFRRSRDTSRFGMAKSFFMGMEAHGIDAKDPKQVDAYTAMLNRGARADLSATTGASPATAVQPTIALPGKVRWAPAPGEAPPPPDAPCPCGSGRRYKKCCVRR